MALLATEPVSLVRRFSRSRHFCRVSSWLGAAKAQRCGPAAVQSWRKWSNTSATWYEPIRSPSGHCGSGSPFAVQEAVAASEEDYATEFLAPVISVRIVADLEEAIEHINHYSSHHTETIVTESYSKAMRFLREVDSSSVMINASTRFADGFEYGLGAEIGISTDKIHARGPVGLEGLTSQKWIVLGNGQVRS